MRTFSLFLAAAILGTAAPALARQSLQERGQADLDRQLAGLVRGKPVNCISLSQIDGSNIADGTAIVYRGLGGTLWVNRPRGAEMLREDDVLVQFVYGSQLCKLDQIKLLDRSSRMERGFIGLGEFVPYTRSRKTAR
jgi:hypothetical protein